MQTAKHRQHFVHALASRIEVVAERFHLPAVPSRTDSQREPVSTQDVDRGDGLEQLEHVALGQDDDAGDQLRPRGEGRDCGQAGERFQPDLGLCAFVLRLSWEKESRWSLTEMLSAPANSIACAIATMPGSRAALPIFSASIPRRTRFFAIGRASSSRELIVTRVT